MATFRHPRHALLLAYEQDIIDTEEFVLLHEINTSKNLDFPFWNYRPFDLDQMTDAECKSELHFLRSDVYRLAEV